MVTKISFITLDTWEHAVPSLMINFEYDKKDTSVGFIEVPDSEKFGVLTHENSKDEIVALEFVDVEEFLKKDGFKYLPDLGTFDYRGFHGNLKDVIYHELFSNLAVKAGKKKAFA